MKKQAKNASTGKVDKNSPRELRKEKSLPAGSINSSKMGYHGKDDEKNLNPEE